MGDHRTMREDAVVAPQLVSTPTSTSRPVETPPSPSEPCPTARDVPPVATSSTDGEGVGEAPVGSEGGKPNTPSHKSSAGRGRAGVRTNAVAPDNLKQSTPYNPQSNSQPNLLQPHIVLTVEPEGEGHALTKFLDMPREIERGFGVPASKCGP
ncbi:Uncharacterized protein Fot_14549 [Forsythia ovata]|uniref:Uncharacterized protein n=1 Tax=Forsythia ovata TaxID=205694 RepID=A0ABD1W722_9LAMI